MLFWHKGNFALYCIHDAMITYGFPIHGVMEANLEVARLCIANAFGVEGVFFTSSGKIARFIERLLSSIALTFL